MARMTRADSNQRSNPYARKPYFPAKAGNLGGTDETLERLAAEHGWGSREVRDYCDDRMALVPDE